MVPSSGIILIRRGSFVRALRGGARPEVRPYRVHTTPSPGSQPGITPATCGILFSEPGLSARGHDTDTRVRSLLRALRGRARPGVRPYRAHTNAEPGLSARGHDNGTRVRSLLRALRGRARPEVRPSRAHPH